ncbi:MAG TPA: hypothetical protein VFL17_01015, partial [Anaerolineae bacterium]|nr:hypothetical protein [Anaerolineae bacterium]
AGLGHAERQTSVDPAWTWHARRRAYLDAVRPWYAARASNRQADADAAQAVPTRAGDAGQRPDFHPIGTGGL